MGMRTLRFTSGPGTGQTREIESEFVIGREGADLTLEDSELSRRHVALRPVERGVEVEDLGSLNGTFVNGERISSPVTLTAPGTLKVGVSQATVEVSLPQVTRMAETPGEGTEAAPAPPGATVARAVPDSEDVRTQEPVADPDVTVQRPIAKPDVAAQEPVADPDVTVQRPVAKPDVTAQRPVQTPDVTIQRPIGSAGPPPPATPPPAPPPKPPEDGGGRSGGPRPALIVSAVGAVLVLIVIVVLLSSGGGEEAKQRKVEVTLNLGATTAEDKRLSELSPGKKAITWKLSGQTRGRPFGAGNVSVAVTMQPVGPPKGKARPAKGKIQPATLTSSFVMRVSGGSVTVTERIQSVQRGKGLKFDGTGRILSGTGDFEGAKGTFKVTGARPKVTESLETIKWAGSVEY